MAIIIGYFIALLGAIVALLLTKGKSRKRKSIIWGIALMVPISPSLSFAIGLNYATIVENGWAALIMWYLFPSIFLIGLVLLLVGIFKTEDTEKNI